VLKKTLGFASYGTNSDTMRRFSSQPTFSKFLHDLQLKIPVIVAPMSGGPTTPELVAAALNAGLAGTLACSYSSPQEMENDINKLRTLTKKPFIVNLFAPSQIPQITIEQFQLAIQATKPFRDHLNISPPSSTTFFNQSYHPNFDKQFEIILKTKPAVFSFVFNQLSFHYINACQSANILTMGTATTVNETLQ
jgi:nitronate monooxygenase